MEWLIFLALLVGAYFLLKPKVKVIPYEEVPKTEEGIPIIQPTTTPTTFTAPTGETITYYTITEPTTTVTPTLVTWYYSYVDPVTGKTVQTQSLPNALSNAIPSVVPSGYVSVEVTKWEQMSNGTLNSSFAGWMLIYVGIKEPIPAPTTEPTPEPYEARAEYLASEEYKEKIERLQSESYAYES